MAAANDQEERKWELIVRPAQSRISRWSCSLFPPGVPTHTEVPHALMPVHIDRQAKMHNNWGAAWIDRFAASYMVSAIEVCPTTQRLHYQFYFESTTQKLKVTTMRNWLLSYFGVTEICFSAQKSVADAAANLKYIDDPDKEGSGWYGDPCIAGEPYIPAQGQSAGLAELIEGLRTGAIGFTETALAYPEIYGRHHKVLALAESQYISRLARNTMCNVLYLWGPTGVGKSHFAFNNFGPEGGYYANPDLFYIYNSDDGRWFDNYRGQEYVIFNEYRGGIPLGCFLQMLDKWPYNVPRRHNAPFPFMAKYILITSAVPPRELYQNAFSDNDRLEQLTRRIGKGEVNVLTRLHMQSIPHFPSVDLAGNQVSDATASENEM